MFDQYLEQLSSTDSSQRRQAIIGLGKSGDARALSPLANVYKNDPDPSLRELALKAGRYLKGLTASVPSSEPVYTSPYSSMMEATTVEPVGEVVKTELPQKEVSYTQRQKAKGRVDYAIGLVAEGRNDKALDELVDAIRINPELVDDQLVRNLATTITGRVSTDDAIAVVIETLKSGVKASRSANRQKADDSSNPNGGIILLISILIYFVVSAMTLVIGQLGASNAMQLLEESRALRSDRVNVTQNAFSQTPTSSAPLLIAGSIETVGALIYTGLLFGIGKLFGGTGHVVDVFNRLLRVQILMYAPFLAAFGFWFFYVFATIPAPAATELTVGQAYDGAIGTFFLISIAQYVWEGFALAKSHHFTNSRGCFTVFVMMCVLVVLGIAVALLIPILVLSGPIR